MILNTDDLRVFYDDDTEIVAVYDRGSLLCASELADFAHDLMGILAVKIENSDAFLLGAGGDRDLSCDAAADTLAEIEEWINSTGDRLRRADELDRQACELRAEAARLRRG